MWRMQSGNRVLTPAEWTCLSDVVDELLQSIDLDIDMGGDDTQTGVAIFDRLTAEQKLLILADTVEALVVPEIPWPQHTAVNEGTIAAIFASLGTAIIVEIEAEMGTHTRRTLLAALADDPPEEMPPIDSDDLGEWDWMVEVFTDRVLWDRDFDMEEIADLPPDVADRVHEMARFGSRDYFSSAAEEPDAAALDAAPVKLKRLIKAATR